ncbi:hypothetical protein [Pyxidicoccus sp. MSG2]|uniref:hypothetical protein n=1 Tax=Pyxidicoccus sp. MSG2 TaxID=2996790 RepID=UPI00226F50F2|nr:hypothetical protein [Pyxidicoccus sp. MSG2]MCY1018155.1 hypothetical protein [Pyxidicoccus sp. MSG2]
MTCAGCCSAGVCQPGSSVSACGTGGAACQTCRSGDTCGEGVCEAPDSGAGDGGLPAGTTTILFEPLGALPIVPDINDVYLDSVTGRLNLPLLPDASPAERAFTQNYLNSLNGFLVSSVPSARASARLDPGTVRAPNIRVIQLAGATSQSQPTIGYNPDTLRISIFPPQPEGWPKGARYVVVLVGGAAGLRDAQGWLLAASPSWQRVRSTTPLVDASGRSTVSGLTDAAARALEALRLRYAPVFDLVMGQGIAREDVAALWTFTVMDEEEAAFDLPRSIIPLPNDLYMSAGGTVQMPVAPSTSSP